MNDTPDTVEADVKRALSEDIGSGDVTAPLLPQAIQVKASVVVREPAVLCGRAWFDEVFHQLNPSVSIQWHFADGDILDSGDTVCELTGDAHALLTGERTALNFLQTLSGTATGARHYADAVKGTGVKILDTRKTIPGLRAAQKYAVRCGGCHNHRTGLFDAILIKENHIIAAGGITRALQLARQEAGEDMLIEIEVENTEQLNEALQAGAERILLDNFNIETLRMAVQMNKRRALLEASGGITLANVATIAATGVDMISVGELTKHVRATDYSMRIQYPEA